MDDHDRREASLDLSEQDFRTLLAGVTSLAEQEVAATRSGPVFAHPPSAEEIDRLVGADRPLPAEGESTEDLLSACAAVLEAGRRTTPAFFGYVQSPPAPVGILADLLASAADQNLTSWRSGPAAAAVEHQTLRWLGEFVGFDAAASGILLSGGSAANLTALLVALHAVTGPDEDRRAMRSTRLPRRTSRSPRRRPRSASSSSPWRSMATAGWTRRRFGPPSPPTVPPA